MKPSVGFSTVKKCFGSNVVVDADIRLLLTKADSNKDDNRIIMNSRYLIGGKYTLVFMAHIITSSL